MMLFPHSSRVKKDKEQPLLFLCFYFSFSFKIFRHYPHFYCTLLFYLPTFPTHQYSLSFFLYPFSTPSDVVSIIPLRCVRFSPPYKQLIVSFFLFSFYITVLFCQYSQWFLFLLFFPSYVVSLVYFRCVHYSNSYK